MMGTTLFIDLGRCIGCQACVAACREADSHRGKSMIHLDYIDAGRTAAAMPTVCMHCEDPVAPCAEVRPADAILVTADGVVQEAAKERRIGCGNRVDACPFGVPKLDVAEMLQYKCNPAGPHLGRPGPDVRHRLPHRGHLLRLGRGAGGRPPGRPSGRRSASQPPRSAPAARSSPRTASPARSRGTGIVRDRSGDAAEQAPAQALLERIRADTPVTRRDYLRILVTVSAGAGRGRRRGGDRFVPRHGSAQRAPAAKVADRLSPARRSPSVTPAMTTGRWPSASPTAGWSAGRPFAPTWPARCSGARRTATRSGPCHDGVFDPATGEVPPAPPRPLPAIRLREDAGGIWAVGTDW